MIAYKLDTFPYLKVLYDEKSGKKILEEVINVDEFIAVKGYLAKGKRVTTAEVKEFQWLEPGPEPEYDEPEDADEVEEEGDPNDREGFAEGIQTELF